MTANCVNADALRGAARRSLATCIAAFALLACAAMPAASQGATGDLIVVDTDVGFEPGVTGNGGVLRVDPETGTVTPISLRGVFREPRGIAFGPEGEVYVADVDAGPGGSGAVFRIEPDTGATGIVAQGGPLVNPTGLARGPDGQLYVSDTAGAGPPTFNGALHKLDPKSGAVSTLVSGPTFPDPRDLGFASDGSLYVTDAEAGGRGAVFEVDPASGAVRSTFSLGSYGLPLGIEAAPDGNLFLVALGQAAQSLVRLDPRTAEVAGIASGFVLPYDVALAPSRLLYVGDWGPEPGGSIDQVDPASGTRSRLAGGPTFAAPAGIAVEPPLCRGRYATIVGSVGEDRIRGSEFDDVIVALGGKDRISGGNGEDRICAGTGRDKINGGKGKDRLYGESGKDRLSGGKGKDKCVGGRGRDSGNGCEKAKVEAGSRRGGPR